MLTVRRGAAAVDTDLQVLRPNGPPTAGVPPSGGVGQGGMPLKSHGHQPASPGELMARAPLGMLCWSKHVVAQYCSEYGDLRLTQYNFWVVHERFAYIVMVTASRLRLFN